MSDPTLFRLSGLEDHADKRAYQDQEENRKAQEMDAFLMETLFGQKGEPMTDLNATMDSIEAEAARMVATAKRLRGERDEALEIVTILAEKLPKGCECDGATDGSGLCLPHRAERLLDELK